MKVVINKCYGGFGLSYAALVMLIEMGSKHIKLMSPSDYFGEFNIPKDIPENGEFNMCYKAYKNKIICDNYYEDSRRGCPMLVKVVEELGTRANGNHSDLAIVEIPDDVSFEIDEYDGMESIHEIHRSWS